MRYLILIVLLGVSRATLSGKTTEQMKEILKGGKHVLMPGQRCYSLYDCLCVSSYAKPEEAIDCSRGYACGQDKATKKPVCVGVPLRPLITCEDKNDDKCKCTLDAQGHPLACKADEHCFQVDAYDNECISKAKFIKPGETCKDGDCFCALYDPDTQWKPHRYAYCHSPGDKCSMDRDILLGCGPREANCAYGEAGCTEVSSSDTSLIQPGTSCKKDMDYVSNALGAYCYSKKPGDNDPYAYDSTGARMVKGLETTLAGKKVDKGCGMAHAGNIVCANADIKYPVIHDEETCFGKRKGCYCVDRTNPNIAVHCPTGSVCSVLGDKPSCTGFTTFRYVECRSKKECGCGNFDYARGIFSGDNFDKVQYCNQDPAKTLFLYDKSEKIANPDNVMSDRVIREYNLFKLANNIPFKMAKETKIPSPPKPKKTTDAKGREVEVFEWAPIKWEIYEVKKSARRDLSSLEAHAGL